MNNYNIHLEIRNPKKQAIDTKLEAMACYLMNQRIDYPTAEEWITRTTETAMPRVRVRSSAVADQRNVGTAMEALVMLVLSRARESEV